ncbi:MAG TPA: L,D-transpeptidase [Gemmatimonadaceae bacterium]|nr:L,D-transpeptidase [Gemmatimonadaceae bacterium]
MSWRRRVRFGALLTVFPIIPLALWWARARNANGPPPIRLEVSLAARELVVIEHGEIVRTYSVAVGTRTHPTPTGSFRTGDIVWNPSWKPPDVEWARELKYQRPGAPANPMQGVKIYFQAPDYYIHGTNDPDSIGEAASHGCIRMTARDAARLARRIERAGGSVPLVIKQ